MPFFAYKGRNSGGGLVQGVLESPDSGGAATQLLDTGITPVSIAETAGPGISGEAGFLTSLFREKITSLEVMLFSRQMYTLSKAGIPILRALTGLQASTPNKAFAEMIGELRQSLDSGRELSAAMAQHPKVFSPFYINMVRVGEGTGMLDQVYMRLFEHIEFERFMREQVKTALRYPSFVVTAMVIAIGIINLFVIPAFAKVFKGFNAELPFLTKVLIATSDFTVHYWYYVLAIIVGAAFLFRSYTASPAGRLKWDEFKMKIPVAGKIVRKATLARFARSFALATKSGVPVLQGLTLVAQTVDNDFIASKVEGMRSGVERGESILRTAANSGVFTPVVLQMIAVGEESGSLDDLMEEIAEMYQREVEYELKTLGAQIEPILIVFLGVLVLILALGVFLPIWDLGKVAIKH
ncbi:MAG TPA: type II secretion system F family protein [Novimethylophilus sp.]|jgi:MSHA biogenesis protein MshG|uniref:type II secretion system F family protein n=1 Tax=Novimethylophilus sp. TaxID=2137426 RepID=UPI002F42FAF0